MQQVTDNVYVETGTFGCNPSFVTTSEGIVMIDTPYLPRDAVKWRDEIAKRGEVRYIINTEHHADHISGNYFFSGTVVSYEGIKEMFESPIAKAIPYPQETIEAMGLDASRGIQDFILYRWKQLDPEGLHLAENYHLNPPTITFSERLSLYVGDHTFELIHLPGHTANEVGVYIPQERVFCTGDNFVHKYQPAMTQCCPLEWIESLEKIEAADADVFVTDVGNKLNGMLTNVRKIEEIRLGENERSIIFEVAKNKRLSQKIEPMKTFLGDNFEITFKEEFSHYVTRLTTMENVINLGLDLLGGMYLDIGVKTEDVVIAILDRMVEEIQDNLTYDNVNYENVSRISDRALEVLLEPDESFELNGENYTRLLERNYDITPITSGFLITIKDDEVKRIKKRSVEQALETIRNRIDQLGVKEPTIQQQGENSIVIQLPGEEDPDKARRVIGTVAVLSFQLVAETGSMDNPGEDRVVLYEEIRDSVTKEVIRRG